MEIKLFKRLLFGLIISGALASISLDEQGDENPFNAPSTNIPISDRIKRSIVDWDRHGDNKLSRQPFDILISELPISYRVKADDSSTTKLTEKSKPTKLARNKWHQIMSFKMRDKRSVANIMDESTSADSTLELELQHAKSRRRRQRHQQKVAGNDFPVSSEAVRQEMEVSSESLMKRESNPGDPKSEIERKIKESGTRPLPVNHANVPANQVNNEMVPIEVQALRNVIAKRIQKLTTPQPPVDNNPKQETANRLEISALSANDGKNGSVDKLEMAAMSTENVKNESANQPEMMTVPTPQGRNGQKDSAKHIEILTANSAKNGKNESANRLELSAMSSNNGKNESAVEISALSANDGKNGSVNKLEMTAMSAENVKNNSAKQEEKTTLPPSAGKDKKPESANQIDIMNIMSPESQSPSPSSATTTVKTTESTSSSSPSPNIFSRIASIFRPESTTTTTTTTITTTDTTTTPMNNCGANNVATNLELTKETKVEVVAQPGPATPPPRPVVQHAVGVGGPVAMRAVAEDDDLRRAVHLNNRAKRLRQISPHNDHENLQIEAFF